MHKDVCCTAQDECHANLDLAILKTTNQHLHRNLVLPDNTFPKSKQCLHSKQHYLKLAITPTMDNFNPLISQSLANCIHFSECTCYSFHKLNVANGFTYVEESTSHSKQHMITQHSQFKLFLANSPPNHLQDIGHNNGPNKYW